MVEKKYDYQIKEDKIIERIISDGNVDINHMILPKDSGLPVHNSNSNVYMIIVQGVLTISLNEQTPAKYQRGNILNIPFDIKMNVYNEDEDILEFFVVKSPSPQNYIKS